MSWLYDKYRILKSEIGVKLYGISLMVDLVNACSFSCPSCPIGHEATRRVKGKMSFDTFKRVLDRIQSQTKIRNILFYIFSEPLLSPDLSKCISEANKRGIYTMVSTNLSNPKNVEACFIAGLDDLRISFSGFENGEYFHKGRDMKQFIKALVDVSLLVPKYKTKVSLIFHVYGSNKHELPIIRKFTEALGLNLIEEPAFFIGWEKIVKGEYTKADRELISHLAEPIETSLGKLDYQDYCYYQRKQICVDANGKLILCRHVIRDEHIVGDIFKNSIKEIRRAMRENKFCTSCKEHKLNVFAK